MEVLALICTRDSIVCVVMVGQARPAKKMSTSVTDSVELTWDVKIRRIASTLSAVIGKLVFRGRIFIVIWH